MLRSLDVVNDRAIILIFMGKLPFVLANTILVPDYVEHMYVAPYEFYDAIGSVIKNSALLDGEKASAHALGWIKTTYDWSLFAKDTILIQEPWEKYKYED